MNTETKPLKPTNIITMAIFSLLFFSLGVGLTLTFGGFEKQTQRTQDKPIVYPSTTSKPTTNSLPIKKGTGGLSFIPNSFKLNAIGDKTTLQVIYSGNDTTVAEIHLNLGTGVKLKEFIPAEGLVVIYESIATNEIHIGKLTDQIHSGETLFSFEVEATGCTPSGQISIDAAKTKIVGININTFGTINYEVGCNNTSNNNSEYNKQITFCNFTRPEIEDPSKKCFLTANIKDNWELVYNRAETVLQGAIKENDIKHLAFYRRYNVESINADYIEYTLTKYTLNDGTKIYEEQYKDMDGNITYNKDYKLYTFGEVNRPNPNLGFWTSRYTIDSPEIQEVLKSIKILRTDFD